MKKNTAALLSTIILISINYSALAIDGFDDIWLVVNANYHGNIGCKDTLWFKMSKPVPALETSRGNVVEIGEYLEYEDTDINNPATIIPHKDADIWLSADRDTIYVVIRNLKQISTALSNMEGDFNGPWYTLHIYDRFTPKKDDSPDEVIFKQQMSYSFSRVLFQTAVEEDSRTVLSQKVGNNWYAPFYVDIIHSHETTDKKPLDFLESWLDVETMYEAQTDIFFGDRKFLRWEKIEAHPGTIDYPPNSNPLNNNYLKFAMRCGAITGAIDLTITPIYSKPIPRWSLTITMDSTIKQFNGKHYYPNQQWLPDSINGESEVHAAGDTILHFSLLKDSVDYFDAYSVVSVSNQIGIPMRMISNVPEFNIQGNGDPFINNQLLYYQKGFDSVHIHFTRSKEVVGVEESISESGMDQLEWHYTSDHDILLKAPFHLNSGRVELYTMVGSMIKQSDISSLANSSEGMLIQTATIPFGTYIILVKAQNYLGGTVIQINH